MTPESLKAQLTEKLGSPIKNISKLSGGCSYPSFVVETDLKKFFVKTDLKSSDVFQTEATGLKQLQKNYSHVPEVITFEKNLLILEYIEPSTPTDQFWKWRVGINFSSLS